ncbi:MAG: DUF4344 domain-containing metallopeptidase [Rhodobacteraceae bacterium]|nr:DUF4344 domain-containing metallopeptidase [Paracoccaceae bacterium]
MRIAAFCLIWAFALTGAARASDEDDFVAANLIAIFYHEMGHALIDILNLPVFGQEEDAADVASVVMIHEFFEESHAQALMYDAALGLWAEVLGAADDVAFWGVHGPEEQRFYNAVCLFYGGNPDERDDFAADMELPAPRADTCEDEFQLAYDSWMTQLDDVIGQGRSIRLGRSATRGLTFDVIAAEIDALNRDFRLPQRLTVMIEACDEANAFYVPGQTRIIMCTEFEDHLRDIYRGLGN